MSLLIDANLRDLLIAPLAHLARLLADVEQRQPDPVERGATRRSDVARLAEVVPPTLDALVVEAALDRLVETADWQFPTQVLPRPLPDLDRLIAVAQERRARAAGAERRQIAAALAKLRRARRITAEARSKRRARQRRRPQYEG